MLNKQSDTKTVVVDVLVVGGGPAGIIAATAAASGNRKNSKKLTVALVESRGYLGGNLNIGIPILGFLSEKRVPIIKGLPQKFIDRLRKVNAASQHQPCPLHVSITFIEPETVSNVALKMLKDYGVKTYLHTKFSGNVAKKKGIINSITVVQKNKRIKFVAPVVIDSTGNGDVAYYSGVPCKKGSDETGGMQPPTLMFKMSGVNTDKLRYAIARNNKVYSTDYIPARYFAQHKRFIVVGLRKQVVDAQKHGIKISNERTIIITGLRKGDVWINMTRVKGVDGTSARSIENGTKVAQMQIKEIVKYLKGYIPGFENARYVKTAPFLGIRETRRIVGKYVLNRKDLLSCRKFSDAVAVASYPIDIHHPNDNDGTLEWCGDCYDIPYRSLLPRGINNLIVTGRCISTTHEALAAIRVMSTCMATGEAAGRAAAIAVRDGVSPQKIVVQKLRKELMQNGAYLRKK
ncbi:MAG: FAD-dependent oxidoreductase [Elusimicrobiota bacterium]